MPLPKPSFAHNEFNVLDETEREGWGLPPGPSRSRFSAPAEPRWGAEVEDLAGRG